MTVRDALRAHLLPLVLVLSVAFLCASISVQLRAATLPVVFDGEIATFEGRPLYVEFQNRILSPVMQVGLRRLFPASVSDKSVWFALRVVQSALAFLVLYAVAFRLTGGRLRALAAVALVGFGYLWTPLSHAWEYPTDLLDILFMALAVFLALRERAWWLAAVAVLAAMNRESGAFAGIVWMAVMLFRYGPWPAQWWRYLPGVACVGLAAGVVLGLRHWLSHGRHASQFLGIQETIFGWKGWMLHPDGAFPLLVCLVASFVVILRALPRPWTADQRALLLAAAGCAMASFVFGIAGELRIWIPCIVMLSLLAVIGANGRSDGAWVRTLVR